MQFLSYIIQIDLHRETERFYQHLAETAGISSKTYLERILDSRSSFRFATADPLDVAIEEIVGSFPAMPPLPADFTRADIYVDRP